MVKVDVLNTSGEKTGTISLPTEIFAAKINPNLMALAVRVYLANQRKAHARTKTRGEVDRTTAKWYRQKGTGRARHGARSAPLFVGGGVAHGPRGIQNYKLKINKKMKQAALFSALTNQLKEKKIQVIAGLDKVESKTKKMVGILDNLAGKKAKKRGKTLIVMPGFGKNVKFGENVVRSARNIEGVNLLPADLLNTYTVLRSSKIILMKESIDKLKKHFL